MKRYFWHKYYEATGSFRTQEEWRETQGQTYRAADRRGGVLEVHGLEKEGSMIKIPRRRFLGVSPEVEKAVREIIEENITEYFNVEFDIRRK